MRFCRCLVISTSQVSVGTDTECSASVRITELVSVAEVYNYCTAEVMILHNIRWILIRASW